MQLSFQFESLSAFLHMGGYAQYVWLSYGITVVSLGGLIISSMRQRKRILKNIALKLERDARLQQHRSQNQ
ncbi:MAG: heme exporter protein CcmD [Ferrimonas sp.]